MTVISVQATAPGRGAVAVVEVVGEGAAAIVGAMFDRPLPAPGRTAVGKLSAGGPLDEVVVSRVSPAESFSGEETVEVHCHGGRVVAERILRELESRGAARAERSGLIERAVANGRIDRVQAEAHALLPGALTERAARMLLDQAAGALSRAVREGRDVLDTAPLGIALATPRTIVLAGRPNVGKSTLFNALLERDRVLVSEEAGTTRDPVREWIAIEGIPFRLCDTAGVEEGRSLDPLESLSAESARREAASADLLLFLHECPEGARPEEERFLGQAGGPALRVAAKCDLGGDCPGVRVSGRTGEGLAELRAEVLRALKLDRTVPPGAPVVFTKRQKELLGKGKGESLFS